MSEELDIGTITHCRVGIEPDHLCMYIDLRFTGPGWGQGLGRVFNAKTIGPAIAALIHLNGGRGFLDDLVGTKVWVVRGYKSEGITRLSPLRSGKAIDFEDESSPDYFMKVRK